MQVRSSVLVVPFGAFVHVVGVPWLNHSLEEKDRQVRIMLKQLAITGLPTHGAEALDAYYWTVAEDRTEGLLAVNEPNGPQDASLARKLAIIQEWPKVLQRLAHSFLSTPVIPTNAALIAFFKAQQQAEQTSTLLRWQSVSNVKDVKPVRLS